jgi:hypothetical protein
MELLTRKVESTQVLFSNSQVILDINWTEDLCILELERTSWEEKYELGEYSK